MGPLKADFLRRAKTRPPLPLLPIAGATSLKAEVAGGVRTTRMPDGKVVLALGVVGRTLMLGCGDLEIGRGEEKVVSMDFEEVEDAFE